MIDKNTALPLLPSMHIVAEDDRLDFLPEKFQNQLLLLNFDNYVFQFAEKLCREYNGGYWEFVELPNGAFFSYPDFDGFKDCSCADNYAEGSLNGRLLGMICTLLALNHLTWAIYKTNVKAADIAEELYFKLRGYIYGDEVHGELVATLGEEEASKVLNIVYKFLD